MKNKKGLVIAILLAIMITPQFSFSQAANRETTAAHGYGESWMPINKFKNPSSSTETNAKVGPAPLINILNGVSFYVKNTKCNTVNVALLKLINTNNYPVKVSWKMAPESPVSFVEVPARYTSEGACAKTKKTETTDLVIELLSGTAAEKAKKKRYILSSITVTQVKK